MDLLSQNPIVSEDPETTGFDMSAGSSWIYPENYPVREYQFNIVKNALYNNTLVCLPTGLGKTFIAAVIMYNFWRWYPQGKIIFLAPTRPLVAQQVEACYKIMGIPIEETVELTGAVTAKNRVQIWSSKRIIFATPQVLQNDLEKRNVPSELIKCIVIDEAHKALGKHSYCECIRKLRLQNQYFRVVALSATPGNTLPNVHEVLQNLLISHVEMKDETSYDIKPYINERKIDVVLVPLGHELIKFKEKYIFVMDPHVKTLIRNGIQLGKTANICKGRIFHLKEEFNKRNHQGPNHGIIFKTFNILFTMYHAYDLMIKHGLRAFHSFYKNHSDKFWMNQETRLQELLEEIEAYIGPLPYDLTLPDLSVTEIPNNIKFGHNKFERLREILSRHFRKAEQEEINTQAIVFVEYRDIVNEVYVLLLQMRPLIKPQIFVGQAGQKQKQQLQAMENFKNNRVNVLVSTSIGEEGLDLGEVDLIVCFDITQRSPTRLVQRMGRTGRKRDGHIIILVTDGKESETLKSTLAKRQSISDKILNTSNITSSLYQNNYRMVPKNVNPRCMQIHITPPAPMEKIDPNKRKKKPTSVIKKNPSHKKPDKLADPCCTNVIKPVSQSTMTKFLKPTQHEQDFNDSIKTYDTEIKQSNVQLYFNDNKAVDFLTCCVLKKSEEEMQISKETKPRNLNYVPKHIYDSTIYNFELPNMNVLNSLSELEETIKEEACPENDIDDNWSYDRSDYIDIADKVCSQKYNNNNNNERKCNFEALLDTDSSDIETVENNDTVKKSNFEALLDCSDSDETVCSKDLNIGNDRVVESKSKSMFEDIWDELSDLDEKAISEDKSSNNCLNESMFSVTQAIGEINKITRDSSNNDLYRQYIVPKAVSAPSKGPDQLNDVISINDYDWDSDFEIPTEKKKLTRTKRKKKIIKRHDFLDDEACDSGNNDSSDDEGSIENLDKDLDGFVSYTQHVENPHDMTAVYLRTARSPKNIGNFVFKKPSSYVTDVYSQRPAIDEPDTYLHDSFCVDEEDSNEEQEISILDIMEKKLRNKKRKRTNSNERISNKRKISNVLLDSDESSEDETEKLRKQIINESMMLKKC